MAYLNRVEIIGNLGADPEMRCTQSQVPVCNFSVAATERFKDKSGQAQEKTEWVKVVAWDKLAENCVKYLSKGKAVYVEGKLSTRMWEKDGQKHYATEVVATNVQFLTPANASQQQTQGAYTPPQQQSAPRAQPAQRAPQPTGYGGGSGLDDIPF
jgi:single-strand DNA-binding protein